MTQGIGRLNRRGLLQLGGLALLGAACQPASYATREPPRGLALRVNLLAYAPYAPLLLMRERALLQARVPGLSAEWKVIPKSEAVNEALLTGGLDVAVGSPTMFLLLRERGVPVRALAGISRVPIGILGNRPDARSLGGLGPSDRIAVPDAESHEATVLRMAAVREFGDARALDRLLVAASPGAGFAMLGGRRQVSALVGPTPYLDVGRDTPGVHLLADPAALPPLTTLLAYTLPDLRARRPHLVDAFVDALAEAAALVEAEPESVVKHLNEGEELDLSPPTLARYVGRPEVVFEPRIRGLAELARFFILTGQIEGEPPIWRDLVFESAEGA